MTSTPDIQNSTIDALNKIQFSDLFILEDIQRFQDLFSDAHGVASIITYPDGRPITSPSNFCRLCDDIIRKTEKGRANCFKSNAVLGRYNPSGPIVQLCLSGGLWNAGASITVGGKHIANWMISQVRNEEVDEQRMIQYADVIGANREDFRKALNEVPVMSVEQFNKVAKMLFAFANELSEKAYNNLLLKMEIAEREKATELLQKNEEQYRTLFERSNDAIFLVDASTGNYLDANRAAGIMTDRSLNELKRLKTDDIAPKGAKKRLERLLDTNDSQEIGEIEYVRPDGTIRTALLNTIPLSKGYVFEIAHDITGRKQAEEVLVKLKKAIYTSGEAIFLTDREGVFTFVNPAFTSLYGFSSDEIVGKTTPRIIKSGVLDKSVYEVFWQTLLNGDEVRGEIINKSKDGTLITIESSATPVFDEEKNIIGFLGIQRDITNRRQAEEELHESRQILEAIINTIPVRVFWKDKNLTYLGCNTPFALDAGFEKPEDVIGKDDYTMSWGEQAELYRADDRLVIASGKPKLLIEEPQTTSSGEQIYLLTSKVPLKDATGEILGVLGIYSDITKRKQTEDALRESESQLSETQSVAKVGSWTTDLTNLKVRWSKELYRIFELDPDNFQSSHQAFLEFVHPEDRAIVDAAFVLSFDNHSVNTIEHQILTPGGKIKFVEEYWKIISDHQGKPIRAVGSCQDITERKRTEEALRKSEAVQGKMVANIGDVIVIIDQDGINRYKSPNIEKWFGWNPEEVVGKSTWENIHPEDLGSTQKIFGAILGEPNATGTMECRYRCKDGSYKWIEFTGVNLLHDPDIWGLLGNYHDITERKQADQKLGHVARLYALLSQINQAIIRTLEQDELFRTICQVAIEFGQFHMAWVGLTDEANDRIKPVAHAGQEDGYLDLILISTEDVPAGRGPTGSAFREGKIMSYNDIASEPQMLQWRDEAVKRGYRSAAAVPLCRKGKPVGTFTLYATETGFFTAEERKLLQEIGEDISYALDAIDSEIERKQSELKLQRKNEEIKIQNKELQIAKEHAEESDKLKTAFMNNISHEIRTPFNGILGYLSILEDNNLTKSERDEYTSIINKSAYRLMNTINDIVEISQIQAGQMKLTASETNIKRLTSELFDLFKTDAKSQGLQFTITNDLPNNIESVSTDGVKLKTILSILIGNAIKFTKAGSIEFGIICKDKVEDRRDTACRVPTPVEIEFSIKDTGIGISGNKQQAIFERFMQADCSSTRQFEGSGLGLSIASAYAEMLGGKIWVESEEGKGSVFYFTIPNNCEQQEKNIIK